MSLPRLTSMTLLEHDRSAALADVTHAFARHTTRRRLASAPEKKLRFVHASHPARPLCTKGRIIEVVYSDANGEVAEVEPWRITGTPHDYAGGEGSGLTCRPLWMDAGGLVLERKLQMERTIPVETQEGSSPPRRLPRGIDKGIAFNGVTLEDALFELFGPDYNTPAHMQIGGVSELVAGRPVAWAGTNVTLLAALRALSAADQGACEFTAAWVPSDDPEDPASSGYGGTILYYFAERLGRQIEHDQDDPARTLDGTRGDFFSLKENDDGREYFSAVSPVGAEGVTIAEVYWDVLERGPSPENSGRARLQLEADAIPAEGFGPGLQVSGERGDAPAEVLASVPAGADGRAWIEISDAAQGPHLRAGGRLRFASDGEGAPLTILYDAAAEALRGRRVVPLTVTGVTPFNNLAQEAGIAAALGGWNEAPAADAAFYDPDGAGGSGEQVGRSVDFTYEVGEDGLTAVFTAHLTHAEGDAPGTLRLEFGDGESDLYVDQAETHTYAESGTYTPVLTAVWAKGDQASDVKRSASREITVEAQTPPATVQFTATTEETTRAVVAEVEAEASRTGSYRLYREDPNGSRALVTSFSRQTRLVNYLLREGDARSVVYTVEDAAGTEKARRTVFVAAYSAGDGRFERLR